MIDLWQSIDRARIITVGQLISTQLLEWPAVPLPGNIPSRPGFGSRDLGIGTGLGTTNKSVPMDVLGLKSDVPELTLGIYA